MIEQELERRLISGEIPADNIPRQITSITPSRQAWAIAARNNLAKEVEEGKLPVAKIFFNESGLADLLPDKNSALEAGRLLANYRYSVNHCFLSDIATGLLTMLTRNEGLEARRIGFQDEKKKFRQTSVQLICSQKTINKALFGPLVNHNGNAVKGAGDIVEGGKRQVMPFLLGEKAMPRAYASLQRRNGGKLIRTVIEGEPIRVHRKIGDIYVLELDSFFYPVKINAKNNFVMNDQFIHRVAGQTAFLQLGRMLLKNNKEISRIGIDSAVKIMTAGQSCYELKYFAPGLVEENEAGRLNVCMRRPVVPNLYAKAYCKTTQKINWKMFSDAVAATGNYFDSALDYTGIKADLLKIKDKNGRNKILIPATEKGAQFPREFENITYLKVDRIR